MFEIIVKSLYLESFEANDVSVSHSFILLRKRMRSLVINESLAISMFYWHLISYSSYTDTVFYQKLENKIELIELTGYYFMT